MQVKHADGSAPRRNVAVFIDLENLFGGYAGGVSGVPLSRMLREIEAEIEGLGFGYKAAATRAYANWTVSGMTIYRREVLENGVEPIQIFSNEGPRQREAEGRRKNAADIQLVVDALTVAGDAPWVDVFVVVSGDGDFVPLVRRLQYLDKFVVGVTIRNGAAGGVSSLFRSVVDHFLEVDAADPGAVDVLDGSLSLLSPDEDYASAFRVQARATLPSNETPSKEEYAAAVKEIVLSAPNATKDGAVDGAVVYPQLRRRWPRVTYLDLGFKSFGDFVVEACGLAIYHPSQAREKDPLVDAPRLEGRDIRAELEQLAPAISYPGLAALRDVLATLTVLNSALPPEDLFDLIGTQLAETPAEQVRLALSLLFSVGAFRETEGESLVLSSDVRSADEGKALVVQDAKRRATTLGIDINDDVLEQLIFPPAH